MQNRIGSFHSRRDFDEVFHGDGAVRTLARGTTDCRFKPFDSLFQGQWFLVHGWWRRRRGWCRRRRHFDCCCETLVASFAHANSDSEGKRFVMATFTVEGIVFTRQCHYMGSSGPPTADYVWIPSRNLEYSVRTTESKTVSSVRRVTDRPYQNAEQLAKFQRRLKEMWEFNNFGNRGVAVPVMTPELQAKCDERIRQDFVDPNPRSVQVPAATVQAMEAYLDAKEYSERLVKDAESRLLMSLQR